MLYYNHREQKKIKRGIKNMMYLLIVCVFGLFGFLFVDGYMQEQKSSKAWHEIKKELHEIRKKEYSQTKETI